MLLYRFCQSQLMFDQLFVMSQSMSCCILLLIEY